jgi:hypothetical protein
MVDISDGLLVQRAMQDCPTREKHGWLGDAMSTAAEAMLNFNTRTVHGMFLETIADAQAVGRDRPFPVKSFIQRCGSLGVYQ